MLPILARSKNLSTRALNQVKTKLGKSWKFLFIISVPFLFIWIPFVFNTEIITLSVPWAPVRKEPALKGNGLYIIALMVAGWTTNAMPSAPVALISVCLVPLLGLQKASEVALNCFAEQVMLLVGQMMMGCAILVSEIHKRLALYIMSFSGNCYLRLFTSFFVLTLGFSMLISSATTTVVMCATLVLCIEECLAQDETNHEPNEAFQQLKERRQSKMIRPGDPQIQNKKSESVVPITADGVIDLTGGSPDNDNEGEKKSLGLENDLEYQAALGAAVPATTQESTATLDLQGRDQLRRKLRKRLFISIYVAANIGGIGLPSGSMTPNYFYEYLDPQKSQNPISMGNSILTLPLILTHNGSKVNLSIPRYLAFVLFVIILIGPLAWLYLGFVFTKLCPFIPGQKKTLFGKRAQDEIDKLSTERKTFKEKLATLGKVNAHQRIVIAALVLLVLLWFLRDTRIGSAVGQAGFGWASLIPFDRTNNYVRVGDSAMTFLIVICMFVIPRVYQIPPGSIPQKDLKPSSLLGWKFLESNVPWNVAITIGGQHIISHAAQYATLMNDAIDPLTSGNIPIGLVPFVYSLGSVCMGELWGGFATSIFMTPVYSMMSQWDSDFGIFGYLGFSTSILSSLLFMFPVATPTNLLVFWTASGDLTIPDMIKYGALLDLVACIVVVSVHYVLGLGLFDNTNPATYGT